MDDYAARKMRLVEAYESTRAAAGAPDAAQDVLIGYARVSTKRQDQALQMDALERAGCDPIYLDKTSGARVRPQLQLAMGRAVEARRSGSGPVVLVVWKLDRAGRSLRELLELVTELYAQGVGFRCLTQPVDTTTAAGRLVLAILGAVAEFERELIRERVSEGLASRARRGLSMGGRPSSFTRERMRTAVQLVEDGVPKAEIARTLGVSRPALYRALERAKDLA